MDIFGNRRRLAVKSEQRELHHNPDRMENDVASEGTTVSEEDELTELSALGADDNEEEFHEENDNEKVADLLAEREKGWKSVATQRSRPPHDLTVTHVNQSHALQQVPSNRVLSADDQSSEEWLMAHGIEALKLTVQDLVDRGQIGKPQANTETGKVAPHIHFDSYDISEFEYKLNMAIETCTKRIKWLLQGSRRVFGNVRGERVALCIDMSDANCGFGRLSILQESIMHLIDEQLTQKKGLYLVSFGTNAKEHWPVIKDSNFRIIEEFKQWTMDLKPSGGSNLLQALKLIATKTDLDSVCLVLGSLPDQKPEILIDYVHQIGVRNKVSLHTVAYDCNNQSTNTTLRGLSDASRGLYHCYTAACEEQIYSGTDISVLLAEIKRAQEVLNKIKEMREGMMGNALVTVMNEITAQVEKLPQSRFLPRPPGHDLPLRLESPKFHPTSSGEWLKQHGLKAKRLDLYQVLAPNAYSYREDFIPVIKKAVQSQVHEKSMVQFSWHDGSTKNLHVDLTQLFEYQKQLGATVSLYERRVTWLSNASRRIFGTVVENNIILLIDLSVSNVDYLVHIQHSLRLLMEHQLSNKGHFNIITFGSKVQSWKPTMVKPTVENLQAAWKWVLLLQCGGSRNFLGAYRAAVENDEEIKHGLAVQGIYLFTSGVPDQTQDVACSFIEQSCIGRSIQLHTILFNVDDYNAKGAIPSRYANITHTAECLRNMAHCSSGRFHWFRETGIIESDDIQVLAHEIDKAISFSKKCTMLVESVKRKYQKRYNTDFIHEEINALPTVSRARALPAPRSRPQSAKQVVDTGRPSSVRAIGWRPSSASSQRDIVPKLTTPIYSRPMSGRDPMKKVKNMSQESSRKIITNNFFIDQKGTASQNIGSVIQDYPAIKSVRKIIHQPTLPQTEDFVTSKQWMRLYSLSRLRLDLNKLVSGPDCKHKEKNVKALHKTVSAKYCDIFPSVNVNGTMKHLQLLPHELREYEVQVERVLKRYLKRMQWLLTASRRVFGTIVHKKCAILIDTSGSMMPYMTELKKELNSLIWDQLHKQGAYFNLIQFSGSCDQWRESIEPSTEANCHSAVEWSSRLQATGNTCTLEALQLAFSDPDMEAVYLLSDGKPDTSTALVIRAVTALNEERQVPINTISFNCDDSTANNFMKLLALETRGRYHRCHATFDADLFAHKLLTEGFQDTEYPYLPEFEGDDLKRLGSEIAVARKFLSQARTYRSIYDTQKAKYMEAKQEKGAREKVPVFTVGRARTAAVC